MPKQSSQSGDPRTPVYVGRKRIPGLTQRTRRDGSVIFEARVRFDSGGPLERVVLDAKGKLAAVEELAALRVDRRRGEPVRTGSAVPTVAEVSVEWLADYAVRVHSRDPRQRRSPRTLDLYRGRTERHVLPAIGHLAVNQVGPADLRRMVTKLSATLSPATTCAIVAQTGSLFRYAVKQRLIQANPVRLLDRDDRPSPRRLSEPRYLSADEIAALLAAMTDSFRPVAAVCAYAGLRISEVLALTWADVDFAAKAVTVSKQLDGDGSIRHVTKSEASTGQVPLLPALERELREHRSRQVGVNLRLVRSDALVFVTQTGAPQNRRNSLRAVHRAAESVGLNHEGIQPLGLHDLRHSLVGNILDAGGSMAQAAEWARHANAKVTAQIYAGVSEQAKAQVATKLLASGFGS